MKSTKVQLSPTRVRIDVEVPFTELQPDIDRAYKALASKIRLPGFRPGKAPVKLLEARLGRGAVLEQVINEALPSRYGEAVRSNEVKPLGQPDIEITKIEDGDEVVFTAEVDVRPDIPIPDLQAMNLTVDAVQVEDSDIEAELQSLRARFGTLTNVERATENGDFVSIDLSATVDGEEVPEAATEGMSHEVGSGQLVEGLDDAIVGLSAGESRVFTTTLVAGERAGQEAQVTVKVNSVKERELPEPDDEFAQLASEFDTVEELRTSLADQVQRVKRVQQAETIRDVALESLLEQVDVPLPESVVESQVARTVKTVLESHGNDEQRFLASLAQRDSNKEEFDGEVRENAEKAVKTQLLVDEIADELDIDVSQDDLTERLVLQAREYGIEPQQLMQYLQANDQLQVVYTDVRRGKALAAVVRAATIVDTDGNAVDTEEFFGTREDPAADAAEGADAPEPDAGEAEVQAAEQGEASDKEPEGEVAAEAAKGEDK